MAQSLGMLEQLKQMVDVQGPPCTVEVDRTAIRLLMEAMGDHDANRLGSGAEAVVVPPYLFCASMLSGRRTWPEIPFPFRRVVDGGGEWNVVEQIRLGDRITSVTRFKACTERESRAGKMFFLTFETDHRNQKGELVGSTRSTLIAFDPVD
ncbi:MAG: hypothetical protein EPO21_17240 [Chloroflexota bacterium]|nr:MAG: hypothetical protein EPO21_17240 [Chloroflexota bacterium]